MGSCGVFLCCPTGSDLHPMKLNLSQSVLTPLTLKVYFCIIPHVFTYLIYRQQLKPTAHRRQKTRNAKKQKKHVFSLVSCFWASANMFVSRNKCFTKQLFHKTTVSTCRVRCFWFSVSRNNVFCFCPPPPHMDVKNTKQVKKHVFSCFLPSVCGGLKERDW